MGETASAIALNDEAYDPATSRSMGPISRDDDVIIKSREDNLSDLLTYGLPATALGFLDTVGHSVGALDDDDSLVPYVEDVAPRFAEWYLQNQQGAQTAGDVMGMFVPGILAMKTLKAGKYVEKGLKTALKIEKGTRGDKAIEAIFNAGETRRRFAKDWAVNQQMLPATRTIDITTDNAMKMLRRKNLGAAVWEDAQQTLAFELGVYTFMNDSQTLYPDEFTTGELFALNAAFGGVTAGMAFASTNRILRRVTQGYGAEVNKSFKLGTPLDKIVSRPELRGLGITTDAEVLARNRLLQADPEEAAALDNLVRQELTIRASLQEHLKNVFEDKVPDLGKLVNKSSPENGQMELLEKMLESDSSLLIGVQSLEQLPGDEAAILNLVTKVKDDEIQALKNMNAAIDLKIADDSVITTELTQASKNNQMIDKIEQLELYVIESSSEILPAAERKALWFDKPQDIIRNKPTNTETGNYSTAINPSGDLKGDNALLAVDDNGHLLIRPLGKNTTTTRTIIQKQGEEIIDNLNVTEVIPTNKRLQPGDGHFLELLHDMGEDWHFLTGARGSQVFDTLPVELRTQVGKWTGNSASSTLRQWIKDGDLRAKQIMDAYRNAGLHSRLRSLADADGTIPLLRGESIEETLKPTNDVVSFTSSPKIARAFAEDGGKQIVSKRVHVDDIVMIVGGQGKEFEYIVKNNLKRRARPTGKQLKIGGELVEEFTEEVSEDIWTGIVKGNWQAQDLKGRSAAYALMRHSVDKHKLGTKLEPLSVNDHHTRLDWWLAGRNKYGSQWELDAPLPLDKAWTHQDVEYAALRGKYDEFVELMKVREASNAGKLGLKFADVKINTDVDILRMVNLPVGFRGQHSVSEPSAMWDLFTGFYHQGDTSLSEALGNGGMDVLKQKLHQTGSSQKFIRQVTADTLTPAGLLDLPTTGNMLEFQAGVKPILFARRGDDLSVLLTRERLVETLAQARGFTLSLLGKAGQHEAPLIADGWNLLQQNPGLWKASQGIDTVLNGGQAGKGFVASQAKSLGEIEAMQAIHQVSIMLDKTFHQSLGKLYDAKQFVFEGEKFSYNQLAQLIKEGKHAGDNVSFMAGVNSMRRGWDVAPNMAVSDNGIGGKVWHFVLENTDRNRRLLGDQFPNQKFDLKGSQIFMPTPDKGTRTNVALTELARTSFEAFNALDQIIYKHDLHIRNMMGRAPIKQKNWHVAPVNFAGGNNVYIIDDAGQLVQVVNGKSTVQAETLAKREADLRKQNGETAIVVTEKNVEQYFDLQDIHWERMQDFSQTAVQTGKGATGRSIGGIIDIGPTAVDDLIDSYQHQFESLLRRTKMIMYEPQIAYAKKMYMSAGNQEMAKRGQTIWQMYLAEIMGNKTINPNDVVGKTYGAIESIYDDVIGAQFDKMTGVVGNHPFWASGKSSAFKQVQNQLAEYSPFESVVDFAEKTHNVRMPASLRKHGAALNRVTTLLTLRLFEVGHSVLTLTSLAATAPGAIAALKRAPGENASQHAGRIGAYGYMVDADTPMFSPVRAITSGIHFMFSKAGHAEWKSAMEAGYLDQQVAELLGTLTAPHDGYITNLLKNNKLARLTTMLSDKSEVMARGIAYMTNFNIAKRGLNFDDAAARTFAHRQANETIGDYSPNNKPKLFQGAVGTPLSLFMTFTHNYYQRLFSYIENKQTRALVVQYATQAGTFGGSTVPGFQQFADFFGSNYDGSSNLVDGMENRFGKEATEWFLYGSLSNLPKMFGADDGVALYSRGDVTFRNVPTIFTLADTPNYAMVQRGYNLLAETVSMFREREGFSGQQMLEILSNYSTNRTTRSLAELAAGVSTDRGGLVENSQVYSEMSIVARAMGMRPLSENRKMEKMRRTQATLRTRSQLMKRLRQRVRSDIRDGVYNSKERGEEAMHDTILNYVKYGGSAEYFARFLGEQMSAATMDKTQRKFLEVLTRSNQGHEMMRLLPLFEDGLQMPIVPQ